MTTSPNKAVVVHETVYYHDLLGLSPTVGYMSPGRYYSTAIRNCTALTTVSATANRLWAIPFLIGAGSATLHLFTKIAIFATTAVASNVRLGIYANKTGDAYPDALLLDAGVVTTTPLGLKAIAINITFQPGQYWLVLIASANPTLRAAPVASTVPILGLGAAFDSTPYNCWYKAGSYGALPDFFPGGATASATAMPLIALWKA